MLCRKASSSTDMTAEVEQLNKSNGNEEQIEEMDDDGGLKDMRLIMLQRRRSPKSSESELSKLVHDMSVGQTEADDERLKEKDSHTHKLILPPEYDENDSRWTLKYREPAPGLVALIKYSGVYVNADRLDECKKMTNDCRTLAQMLLTEVFTTNALRTCSWAADTSNVDDRHARPRLNEHATAILLKFVAKYGQAKNWEVTDFQCIVNSMRQIMLEMRRSPENSESELSKLVLDMSIGQTKTDDEHLKEKDSYTHKWVLPPEYDENDSGWTLNYRGPAPGLVELIKYSGVYVNADKLAECKKQTNDCKTLARMLLTEIFTTSALRTCSWAGATADTSDVASGHARPGLDKHATEILLKFVVEYGQVNNWEITDFPCILNSMREIILEMRRSPQSSESEPPTSHGSSSIFQNILQRRLCHRLQENERGSERLNEKCFHARKMVLTPECEESGQMQKAKRMLPDFSVLDSSSSSSHYQVTEFYCKP